MGQLSEKTVLKIFDQLFCKHLKKIGNKHEARELILGVNHKLNFLFAIDHTDFYMNFYLNLTSYVLPWTFMLHCLSCQAKQIQCNYPAKTHWQGCWTRWTIAGGTGQWPPDLPNFNYVALHSSSGQAKRFKQSTVSSQKSVAGTPVVLVVQVQWLPAHSNFKSAGARQLPHDTFSDVCPFKSHLHPVKSHLHPVKSHLFCTT